MSDHFGFASADAINCSISFNSTCFVVEMTDGAGFGMPPIDAGRPSRMMRESTLNAESLTNSLMISGRIFR